MSSAIENLASNPIVATAYARDEKEFFGQGWSHYPTRFKATANGLRACLSVYNTPKHTQVNWSLSDADIPEDYILRNGYEWRQQWTRFELTPEESRALAAELGFDIAAWLAGALEACRTDVTADMMARTGNVVDAATFHAARAGD